MQMCLDCNSKQIRWMSRSLFWSRHIYRRTVDMRRSLTQTRDQELLMETFGETWPTRRIHLNLLTRYRPVAALGVLGRDPRHWQDQYSASRHCWWFTGEQL
jgi:hypothetical protein